MRVTCKNAVSRASTEIVVEASNVKTPVVLVATAGRGIMGRAERSSGGAKVHEEKSSDVVRKRTGALMTLDRKVAIRSQEKG
jgi:hypothetical protein